LESYGDLLVDSVDKVRVPPKAGGGFPLDYIPDAAHTGYITFFKVDKLTCNASSVLSLSGRSPSELMSPPPFTRPLKMKMHVVKRHISWHRNDLKFLYIYALQTSSVILLECMHIGQVTVPRDYIGDFETTHRFLDRKCTCMH
jgi:hypothetical protein